MYTAKEMRCLREDSCLFPFPLALDFCIAIVLAAFRLRNSRGGFRRILRAASVSDDLRARSGKILPVRSLFSRIPAASPVALSIYGKTSILRDWASLMTDDLYQDQ